MEDVVALVDPLSHVIQLSTNHHVGILLQGRLPIRIHAEERRRSNTTGLAENHPKATVHEPLPVHDLRKTALNPTQLHFRDGAALRGDVKGGDWILGIEGDVCETVRLKLLNLRCHTSLPGLREQEESKTPQSELLPGGWEDGTSPTPTCRPV